MESIHISFKVLECYGICDSNWIFSGSTSSYFISWRSSPLEEIVFQR